jgi:hypothetical protein
LEAIAEAKHHGCQALVVVVDSNGNHAVKTNLPRAQAALLVKLVLSDFLLEELDAG